MTTYVTPPTGATKSSAPSASDWPTPPVALVELMTNPLAPQRKFKIPKASWLQRLRSIPDAAAAIEALPAWINRDDAIAAFRTQWPDNVVGAFAACMVWAYGEKAGYAPYRVLRVLTACQEPDGAEENPRVRDALRRAIDITLADGAVEGYSYLNDCTHKVKSHQRDDADLLVGVDCGRIYGLGPSFFTKWLHVGTLALGGGPSANHHFSATHPKSPTCVTTAAANTASTTGAASAAGAGIGLGIEAATGGRTHVADVYTPAPMLDNQALAWLDAHAQVIDRECLAEDHSRRVGVLHRRWHEESVFAVCGSDCPFTSGEATNNYTGLFPIAPDEFGWSPTTPEGDLLRIRPGRTDDYEAFIALLTAWGQPHRLSASEVCDRIYRLIRKDGQQRQSAA